MEAEEENLTEEKRLSLGQEVSKYQIHVFVQDCNFLLLFVMKGLQIPLIVVCCQVHCKACWWSRFFKQKSLIVDCCQVYSLQLVVEMRGGEVRSLRQQLALANQQVRNIYKMLEMTTDEVESCNDSIFSA